MTSIHPGAIEWKPAMPVLRSAVWQCRLGYVYQTVAGVWQAVRHPQEDCGEHKNRKAAMRAVER